MLGWQQLLPCASWEHAHPAYSLCVSCLTTPAPAAIHLHNGFLCAAPPQADVLHYASRFIELLQQTSSADCAHAQATAAALVYEHKAQQLLSELQAMKTSSSSADISSSNSGNAASPSSSAASEEAHPDADPDAAAAAFVPASPPVSAPASSALQEPYTTQLLREVFTPDRVLQAQAMGLQELVALFKSLSFRMAFQLGLPESRAALLSGSLKSTLHEYA